MATIQLQLDSETSARLAFLAEMKGKRKVEEATELLKKAVFEEFGIVPKTDSVTQNTTAMRNTRITRGHPVTYVGNDPKLQNGKTYSSYAEVLRKVRPELQGLLYNAKIHKGDKAENILKKNEPAIYKDLVKK